MTIDTNSAKTKDGTRVEGIKPGCLNLLTCGAVTAMFAS